MRVIASPLVGEDPRYASLGGGVDELHLLLWRRGDSECDDEGVLAFQTVDQCGIRGIVNLLDSDTRGKVARGLRASDCGDGVFSSGKEGISDMLAYLATGLYLE